jgi:predicted nucleotidyltransferase
VNWPRRLPIPAERDNSNPQNVFNSSRSLSDKEASALEKAALGVDATLCHCPPMNPAVAAKLHASEPQLAELCRACGVERLELFGSARGDVWEPEGSDVDLLVRFRVLSRPGIADDYLRLAEGLESLLGCEMDLLTEESVRNPFFRQRVEETREPVYAA